MNFPTKTSFPMPWALFKAGGAHKGKRPCTALYWIVEARAVNNEIREYRAMRYQGGSRGFAKHARWIPADQMIRCWRRFLLTPPPAREVNASKRKLEVSQ